MANKKKNQRHLTLTERTYIEQELVRGSSFKDIGNALGKDPSTISKEVRLHYETRDAGHNSHGCRNCLIRSECTRQHLCGSKTCTRKCKSCTFFHYRYNDKCPDTVQHTCNIPFKPPYVCNGCNERVKCALEKHFYHAAKAQKEYEKTLTLSRQGIHQVCDSKGKEYAGIYAGRYQQAGKPYQFNGKRKPERCHSFCVSKNTFRQKNSDSNRTI